MKHCVVANMPHCVVANMKHYFVLMRQREAHFTEPMHFPNNALKDMSRIPLKEKKNWIKGRILKKLEKKSGRTEE